MRASAEAERGGTRTVSVIAESFMPLARAIAQGLGVAHLAVARYPGVIMTASHEELRAAVETAVVPAIIAGLSATVSPRETVASREPAARDIVFAGALDEVQEFFHGRLWTDGLPIIPPTIDRVDRFLRHAPLDADHIVAVLPPEHREATIWSIAVNGVMAGCRPEYMPVLVATAQAIADPRFRLQDAGSTPGWEPLIILNGPIIGELDFNHGPGVLRVGRQANTSIGRFLRLYMRNVAGFRIPPGRTDMATIGQSFNVVLAEDEAALRGIGWQPFSVDQGFEAGENVVTVQSIVSISPNLNSAGERAEDHAKYIAALWGHGDCEGRAYTGVDRNAFYPLLVMSPSIARAIARDGWDKAAFKRYLHDNVRMPAATMEDYAHQGGKTAFDLRALVARGGAPRVYWESDDPQRLVPVFFSAEQIGIVVAGDPGRNQSKGYVNTHRQGPPTSRRIELPKSRPASGG